MVSEIQLLEKSLGRKIDFVFQNKKTNETIYLIKIDNYFQGSHYYCAYRRPRPKETKDDGTWFEDGFIGWDTTHQWNAKQNSEQRFMDALLQAGTRM